MYFGIFHSNFQIVLGLCLVLSNKYIFINFLGDFKMNFPVKIKDDLFTFRCAILSSKTKGRIGRIGTYLETYLLQLLKTEGRFPNNIMKY